MKNSYPRVLIGVPTAEVKSYCQDRFIASVKMLSYPNKEIVFIDNSPTKDNYKKIVAAGFKAIYQNPAGKDKLKVLADAHEELRQYMLRGGYDYLFHHESDVFPKRIDIIEELILQKKQVVAGIYNIGEGADRNLSCSIVETSEEGRHEEVLIVGLIQGECSFINGGLRRIFNPALGCTLFKRKTLESFKFRYVKGQNAFPDYFMAVDLFSQGIPVYVHTGVICEHDNINWGIYGINYK